MREAMLIIHFIGLAMGLGTSFAHMFLAIGSAKMEKDERLKFVLNSFSISRMGQIGLVLLVVSGGYLMTPHWKQLTAMPLLMAKLALVLILAGLIGYITSIAKKAKKGDTEAHLNRIKPFGQLTLLIALTIVVLAVLVFR